MRRVSIAEVDGALGDLLRAVCDEQQPVVIERGERTLAVLITPRQWEDYQEFVKARFIKTVQAIREMNADADPDEVMREVTEAVEEVRQAAYERRLRDQGRR